MLIATFSDVFSWRLPVKILSDSRIFSVSRLLQQLSIDKAAFPTICVLNSTLPFNFVHTHFLPSCLSPLFPPLFRSFFLSSPSAPNLVTCCHQVLYSVVNVAQATDFLMNKKSKQTTVARRKHNTYFADFSSESIKKRDIKN